MENAPEEGTDIRGEGRTAPLTAVELFVQREEKLTERKASISLIESQLVENPEGNVRS